MIRLGVAVGLGAVVGCGIVSAGETAPALQDSIGVYRQLAAGHAMPPCAAHTEVVTAVAPDPQAPLDAAYDEASGQLQIRYRMAFNQVTEGWNWHPEAKLDAADYYRYKFLPLGSVTEPRPAYRGEDKLGEPQTMRVEWRYDYFFAFDNLYDFYPRAVDDDAGFAVTVAVSAATARRLIGGDLRMALRGRLAAQCLSESTTFWKAIHARPVDFTLKKRYLIGQLDEVLFVDRASGQLLARSVRLGAP